MTETNYVCNGSELVAETTAVEDNPSWEKLVDSFYFVTVTWTTGDVQDGIANRFATVLSDAS